MSDTTQNNQTRTPEPVVFAPSVDVLESRDDLRVIADLPGVSRDSLSIDVHQGTLTIEGTRPSPAGERPVLYRRTFQLSSGIDSDKVEASLEAGVLTVRLPRSSAARPRRINVTAG